MITAQQAITNWENFYDSSTGISEPALIQMVNILNQELYNELYEINVRDYVTESTIVVAEGTKEYTLPTDFETVALSGCGLYEYYNNDYQREVLFDVRGVNLRISDVLPSGTVLKLRYIPTIDNLTSLTEETVIPNRFQEVLLHGLAKLIALRDEDIQKYNNCGQMYAEAVEKMKGTIRNTSPVYTLSDPLNPF